MKHNYKELLNISYKKYKMMILMLSLLLIFFLILFTKTYNTYNTYSLYSNNYYLIDVPLNNSDAVMDGSFIKIKNKKYKYQIINISGLLNEDNINYQEYLIKIDKLECEENEVNLITFYYDKQRLISKIAKIII